MFIPAVAFNLDAMSVVLYDCLYRPCYFRHDIEPVGEQWYEACVDFIANQPVGTAEEYHVWGDQHLADILAAKLLPHWSTQP